MGKRGNPGSTSRRDGMRAIVAVAASSALLGAAAAMAGMGRLPPHLATVALATATVATLLLLLTLAGRRRDRRSSLNRLESALLRAGEAFAQAGNETAAAQVLADAACNALGARLAWIARWDAGALQAVPVAAAATRPDLLAQLPAAFVLTPDSAHGEDPLGSTLTLGRARLIRSDQLDGLDNDWAILARRSDCHAVMLLPLRTGQDMWGAAAFCYEQLPAAADRRLLQTLARRAGRTVTTLSHQHGGLTPAESRRETQRTTLTEEVAAMAIGAESVPALLRSVLTILERAEGFELSPRDGFVLTLGAGPATRFIGPPNPQPFTNTQRHKTPVSCGDANYGELSVSLSPDMEDGERKAAAAWLHRIAVITALGIARLRGDEGLAASEARYRTIFEALGIGYFEISRSGRFTYVNDSAAALLSGNPHDVLGTNTRQYMDAATHRWIFEIYNAAWHGEGTAVANGYAVTGRDGTSRLISSSALVRHGPLGEPVGFRGILVDETERHLTERRLRENERLFRALAESSPVAILMHRDLRWIFANRAAEELTGYSHDELVGEPILDIVAPEARGLTQRQARARLRGELTGKPYTSEIRHADGSLRIVEIYGNRITSDDQPAAIISVIDITRQRDVLERAQRLAGLLDAAETLAAVGSFEWEPGSDSLLVSPTFAGLTGRPAQVLRLPVEEFLDSFVSRERETLRTFLRTAADVTEPCEMRVQLVDDEDDERRYLLRAAPHLASSQDALTVVGIIRPFDISHRHQAEEETC